MTDAPKLKPCPFCGGAATWAYGSRGWKVECEGRFGACAINARTHYQPAKHLAVAAWNTRADLIDMDVLRRVVEALEWQEDRRKDALVRTALNAPEDPHVEALCERYGYGAVMDAAARLWTRKDPMGAFYVGGCVGGTSEPQALVDLRAMMEKINE